MRINFTAASADLTRRVSFYSMDLPELPASPQNGGSTQIKIDILDPNNGYALLASTNDYISDTGGVYITFEVTGSFQAHIQAQGDMARLAGIFVDGDSAPQPQATYVGEDRDTKGVWIGNYGKLGAHMAYQRNDPEGWDAWDWNAIGTSYTSFTGTAQTDGSVRSDLSQYSVGATWGMQTYSNGNDVSDPKYLKNPSGDISAGVYPSQSYRFTYVAGASPSLERNADHLYRRQ